MLECTRVSGFDGAFQAPNGIVAHLQNWNMGINAPISSEARSNTQGYQVSWAGAKSANGGFSVAGVEPLIKIRDSGIFTGYTGGGVGKGRLYKLKADVNNVVLNFDWQNRTSSMQYQFVSNYQAAGDELIVLPVTSGNIIKDISLPRSFVTPASDGTFFPIVLNDQGLCAQNATITFSAQPNTLSDSCTGGWQTVLGMGAVNVTFNGTMTCNDISQIPDVGKCNTLDIYTDACDLEKKWSFKYFLIGGKESLTVNNSGEAVTYTLNMTFSIAPCDCGITAVGSIIDPNGVAWVGQAA